MRPEIEDFLFAETALLDAWDLETWLGLFTEDASYLVPALDAIGADPRTSLAIIADDMKRLRARVKQMLGKSNWAEQPRSRTRHMVSNVRIVRSGDDGIDVVANFVVFRARLERVETYMGHYEHTLVRNDGALKFLRRKAVLDLEALREHGSISVIL